MALPGRQFNSDEYRYSYNGKEQDNEIKGSGNSLDFGARIYDSRSGRWLSTDPLQKKYPELSPYNFCNNNPLYFLDPDGRDIVPHPDFIGTKGYFVWIALTDNKSLAKYIHGYKQSSNVNYLVGNMIAPKPEDHGFTYSNLSSFGKTFKATSYYNQDANFNDLSIAMTVIHEGIHASLFFQPKEGGSGSDHHEKMAKLRQDMIIGGKEFANKLGIDVSSLSNEDWESLSWMGLETTSDFQRKFDIKLDNEGQIIGRYKDKEGRIFGSKKHSEYQKKVESLVKDPKFNMSTEKSEELKTEKLEKDVEN